jgi:hypothetical protein
MWLLLVTGRYLSYIFAFVFLIRNSFVLHAYIYIYNRNAVKEQLAIAGRETLQIMAAIEGAITLQPSKVHVLEIVKDHENNNCIRVTRSSSVKSLH